MVECKKAQPKEVMQPLQALQHGAKQAASKLGLQSVGSSQLSNVSAAAALQAAANSALFRSAVNPYGLLQTGALIPSSTAAAYTLAMATAAAQAAQAAQLTQRFQQAAAVAQVAQGTQAGNYSALTGAPTGAYYIPAMLGGCGYGAQGMSMSGANNGASPANALLAAQLAQLAAAAAAASSASAGSSVQSGNGGALDLSQSSDALSSYLQSVGQLPLASNPMLIPASALQPNGYH